ncbi:MAG: serine protease [Lachnospiraceae bacterium]|nr:serine protease [Lachnospiraceae bacterium]
MEAAEFLQLSTIRIETTIPGGVSTGTGFFFSFKYNEETYTSIPVIVTNKHVIKNAITGKLRFSLKDENGNPMWGKFYDLQLNNFESRWIMHPEDDIDLCILPIAEIHREIAKLKYALNYSTYTARDIPSDDEYKSDFSRIEDITIVGYPDGIWDSINNIPITRKGITATPLQIDFEKSPKFLVDAAIYPGSSGSPVFVFNQGSYTKPGGGLYAGNRLKLVGIIFAVAQHTVTGELKIIDVPAAKTSVAQTLIPNNLGVAIHSRKLLDFEKLLK